VVALVYCVYLAARRGIGAWLFQKNSPAAIQSAIKWDPANPQYYDALAGVIHYFSANAAPEEIVRLDENATRLSPYNAQYWADLGAAREWAGRSQEAAEAFDRAQQLFPNSPGINWRVANFDVRSHKVTEGLRALQRVLLGGSVAPRDVFALATRATGNDQVILALALPPRAPVTLDSVKPSARAMAFSTVISSLLFSTNPPGFLTSPTT